MDNNVSTDISDLFVLRKKDLEIIKLRKEVYLLEEQIKDRLPKKTGFLEKTLKYLQNNVGKIIAIAVLLGAVINPVLNYIASQRKAHLIRVSNDMFNVLDSTVDKRFELISTQDPNLVAPYLLNLLSAYKIKTEDAYNIYVRMYKLNTEMSNYTLYDKVLFLFVKSNKSILENELGKGATNIFHKELTNGNDSLPLIIRTYVDIIYELKLEKKTKLQKALDILRAKCANPGPLYKNICDYLVIKSKQNETN